MNRSLRSAVCAATLMALGASAANAQTLPTTTPPSTTFTLPTACQAADVPVDDNHGEAVRACVDALRAQLGDGQGLGDWVSQFASENGQADGTQDQDTATAPTTGTSTSTGTTSTGAATTGTNTPTGTTTATGTNTSTGTTTTTGTTSTGTTSTSTASGTTSPDAGHGHGHGHGHQLEGGDS